MFHPSLSSHAFTRHAWNLPRYEKSLFQRKFHNDFVQPDNQPESAESTEVQPEAEFDFETELANFPLVAGQVPIRLGDEKEIVRSDQCGLKCGFAAACGCKDR